MFKLIVRFKGNCAFAPKSDGTEARVFLLNDSRIHESRPNLGLIPHHAALTVRASHLTPTAPDVPGRVTLFLRKERLRIIPAPNLLPIQPQPLEMEGFHDLGTSQEPSLVKPPKSNDRGVWWIAPLERACSARHYPSGAGTLDRDFLQPVLDPEVAQLLAARFEIQTGSVRVGEFLKDGDNFIAWRFRNFAGAGANGDHIQILAGEIILEQVIEGDYVSFEAASLEDPDDVNAKRILKLYPRDEGDGNLVDVTILNEEADEFVPNRIPESPILKKPRSQDRIFESFYKLGKNVPPPDELPIPVADYLVGEQAGRPPAQSAPPCSPTRLEPYA